MQEQIIKPVKQLLAVLTVAVALYCVNLAVVTYVTWDANQGVRAQLTEQNQQMAQYIQQIQAQQQQGAKAP